MSCNISDKLLEEYPRQFDLLFASVSGETIPNTLLGFATDWEKVANATATPEFKNMKLIRADKDLLARPILLQSIEFFPYDTVKAGGTGQDAGVIAELIASRSTDDIYPQSLYKNAMMPLNWQPNYFNYTFLVNGNQVIDGLDNPNDLSIADLSIGQPLPYCIEIMKKYDRISSFKLSSRFAQYITSESKYQNYPLLAKVSLRIKDGY